MSGQPISDLTQICRVFAVLECIHGSNPWEQRSGVRLRPTTFPLSESVMNAGNKNLLIFFCSPGKSIVGGLIETTMSHGVLSCSGCHLERRGEDTGPSTHKRSIISKPLSLSPPEKPARTCGPPSEHPSHFLRSLGSTLSQGL